MHYIVQTLIQNAVSGPFASKIFRNRSYLISAGGVDDIFLLGVDCFFEFFDEVGS